MREAAKSSGRTVENGQGDVELCNASPVSAVSPRRGERIWPTVAGEAQVPLETSDSSIADVCSACDDGISPIAL